MADKIRNQSFINKLSTGTMILLSMIIGIYAIGFQLRIGGSPGFHARFDEYFVPGSLHVISGAVVLLIGGLQFLASIRGRWPFIHRWLGRIYLTAVLFGGVAGLVLAPFSDGGLVAHFGFGLLAIVWLYTGWQGWRAIRAGEVQLHREWMMRNFSLAFGAVTLRIYLGLFTLAGIPFEDSYPVTSWLAWVPNLILVEWYLAAKRQRVVRTAVEARAATKASLRGPQSRPIPAT